MVKARDDTLRLLDGDSESGASDKGVISPGEVSGKRLAALLQALVASVPVEEQLALLGKADAMATRLTALSPTPTFKEAVVQGCCGKGTVDYQAQVLPLPAASLLCHCHHTHSAAVCSLHSLHSDAGQCVICSTMTLC